MFNLAARFSHNRLAIQMVLWFMGISLLPLTVATYFNYQNAAKIVKEQVYQNLWGIANRQANVLRSFLQSKEQFVSVVASTPELIQATRLLINTNLAIPDPEAKKTKKRDIESIRKSLEPTMKGLLYEYGFSQMYIVSDVGDVLLSSGKNPVTYSNLIDGPLADSPLGHVYQNVSMFLSSQFSNFSNFMPINAPVLFIGTPIMDEGKFLGVLVLQIESEKIYRITENYNGLGETGETFLIMKDGDRAVVLTPLRHVQKAILNVRIKTTVDGKLLPVGLALTGDKGYGEETLDYRDQKVLAAWDYFPRLRWGLIVKIDQDETLASLVKLRQLSVFIGMGTLIVVLVAAILAAGSITQPIIHLMDVADKIAKGDLTPEVINAPGNEIGLLARAIETMARNLKSLVGQVKHSGTQVAIFVQDISSTMEAQANFAQENGTVALGITASAKEISITSKELAGTMQEVNEVAQDTALLAESGIDGLMVMQKSMKELTSANDFVSTELEVIQYKAIKISSIITTMTKVADQTNLLSLNASIEARKAKEYGTGFRVVAREIRRLADQTAASALEIETMIREMSEAVQNGVQAMRQLSKKVEGSVIEIGTVSNHLSNVIQQVQGLPPRFEVVLHGMQSQSEGADQIKESISKQSLSAQQTIVSLRSTANQVEKLKTTARALQREISRFQI